MAEWSVRRTRNPAVPGSSPALATCWICALSSRVQILVPLYACKTMQNKAIFTSKFITKLIIQLKIDS